MRRSTMKPFLNKPCSRRHLLKETARLCCHIGLSAILLDNVLAVGRSHAATAADKEQPFEPAYLEIFRSGELIKQ